MNSALVSNPSKTRLGLLKEQLRSKAKEAQEQNRQLVLASWAGTTKIFDGKDASKWIGGLTTWDGQDMYQAIEAVMKANEEISDCFIICDGELHPFGSTKSWNDDVVARWKDCTFHIVAFGADAIKHEAQLNEMVGAGNFQLLKE